MMAMKEVKKVAIHHRHGSFSDLWIEYFLEKNVSYVLVNCYDSDIMDQLEDCAGLMWHWDLNDYQAPLMARQLTYSLQQRGIKVYPDFFTSWHYDDKVGQKYLLEAIHAPLVQSYVFYNKKRALEWAETATFPKVFKLRNGASSSNVFFAENREEAKPLIRKAFGKGFAPWNPARRLDRSLSVLKKDKDLKALKRVLTGTVRLAVPKENENLLTRERGYAYFQDYLPGNTFDIRTVVIGDRCFGAKRFCRPGDFRASGSGLFSYNPQGISENVIKTSFEVAEKLKTQSIAYDFIYDQGEPRIVEISYCFALECCDDTPGYWDKNLHWHEGKMNLQKCIAEDFLQSLHIRKPLAPTKVII
jgi:glutathione synthase/RimK-type ligase-like ATP-grasp enzyme